MKEIVLYVFRSVQKHWPVLFRATMYFWLAVIMLAADELKTYADMTPEQLAAHPMTTYKLVWLILASIGAGLISLRAYYDGSAQRHADELLARGDTTTFTKP